ncbi:MAG TPA: NAD(P)/FAD-dependent oxidoreductase [Bacteroidia bacterium]|nr:NAD(P)/FAD-dependent oxidoreductase [Bacteroidia bacterium]
MDIPKSAKKRVVIVGGGFGGIELVRQLKGRFQVVLIDKNNFHTFQPLLYQVATAGIEADSIVFPLRKIFKGYKDFYFRMAEAIRIDQDAKVLTTSIGTMSYDYLVIATGTDTSFFGNEKLRELTLQMKTVREALDLRSYILQNFEKALTTEEGVEREALLDYVIAGAGPTGVELAGALSELKRHVLPNDYPEIDFSRMQIYLLDGSQRVLAAMHEKSSEKALGYLKQMGVDVWLNTRVTDYDGLTVTTNTGKQLHTRTLVWAAGVKGVPVAGIDAAVINAASRILTDRKCKVKGSENLYVIGDAAYIENDPDYAKGHPQVAQGAIQQATLVGKNFIREQKGEPLKDFSYYDKGSMATIGRNRAVVEISWIKTQGFFAWLMWMFVHLMSLVGFRNRLVVLFNWTISYINYDRGMRLIIRPFRKNTNGNSK